MEQHMAKLQARMLAESRGGDRERDETDSGPGSGMRRSKSGDLVPRPDNLSLGRSQSGEWRREGGGKREEILDEDAKKMLKD